MQAPAHDTTTTSSNSHSPDNLHSSFCGQCGICLNAFPFNDPVTAFANCAHVVCRGCLKEELQSGADRCPCCRLPVTITLDDVDHLPLQTVILQLHAESVLASDQPPKPVVCREHDSPATHYCLTCNNGPFCSDCTSYHQRARSTKDHRLDRIDSDEIDLSQLGAHGDVGADQCAVHKGQMLNMCCVTCEVHRPVCLECWSSPKHADHSFRPLTTQLPKLKQHLSELVQRVNAVADAVDRNLQQRREQAAQLIDDIDKQVAAKQAEIKMLLERKHKELKPIEADILSLEIVQLTIQRAPAEVTRKLEQSNNAKPHGTGQSADLLGVLSALQAQPLLEHVLAVAAATTASPPAPLSASHGQQWTPFFASPLLRVNNAVITHGGLNANTWGTVVEQRAYTQGIHSFTVHVLTTAEEDPSYTINAHLGVTSNPNFEGTEVGGGLPVPRLCQITITVDMNKHNMSVAIDGHNLGVVHHDLPATVYPAISLYHKDDQVKVTFSN
eukprot:TRINITY_DN7059_c0_g3_i2.p1 TRINITY_DN7059_c0_g3~~TRINITY_DN7059_c0_g3_i2.p1  ORF type:complete len:499 (+),score=90.24 TRINITY_DN7059_c0_g3_i2:78-1574(+)